MTSVDHLAHPDKAATVAAPRLGTRFLGPVAIGLALVSAFVTFMVLTGLTPVLPTHEVVVTVLCANALAVALLTSIIGWELWQVIQARRAGRAGAGLHVRIVGLFSVIAAVPAILVAVVASITLERGLDRWFSTRTRAVIENSMSVAEAYVRVHTDVISGDLLSMAFDMGRAKPLFDQNRPVFRQVLAAQASVRGLPSVIMFDKALAVIERVDAGEPHPLTIPPWINLADVTPAQPGTWLAPDANYVAAVVKLNNFVDAYLYAARPLDPNVIQQLRETQASVAEYASLEARRAGVQVAFALMYTVIALIILLSAVWIGLNFANRLVAPIRRLIGAAGLISAGNFHVQVPVRRSDSDLARLGESFNKMTEDLRTQRDDLVRARDLIDVRRRFTEAVLAGASAGVIGIDAQERISIMNRSAEQLLGRTEPEMVGQPITAVLPELAPLIESAHAGSQRLAQGQITFSRDGRDRIVSVRVTSEQQPAEAERGYVITLDDITELVSAQRSSAWADIARRIAHEIKNPLTPIQLSAERLKRKYGKVITQDRAIFEQCTDTIVRQVDDIKRMVDEFSRFARMPKPVMAEEDVSDTVRQIVFLMQNGHPDIDIVAHIPDQPILARFDRRLISQALTNITKNAAEAISAVPPDELGNGRIEITVTPGEEITIDVVDNGIGLPKENRSRLLEPYVTTREKGTGLGLAIVERILEEHGGGIELNDAPVVAKGGRGAWVRLRFAANRTPGIEENQVPAEAASARAAPTQAAPAEAAAAQAAAT